MSLIRLSRHLPVGFKTMIAVRAVDLGDERRRARIQAAVVAGHELVFASPIPQVMSPIELEAFRTSLLTAKTTLFDQYGFNLKKVYNSKKMVVLSTAHRVVANLGLSLFTRSFQSNLRRPDAITQQMHTFDDIYGDDNLREMIVQVVLKSKKDAKRLQSVALSIASFGYVVAWSQPQAIPVAPKFLGAYSIIDGFSCNSAINQEALLSATMSAFTVTLKDITTKRKAIKAALKKNLTPIFRFSSNSDPVLGQADPRFLSQSVLTASKLFKRKYGQALKHVLLPASSSYSDEFEQAGITPIRSDLHLNSRQVGRIDRLPRTLCWELQAETDPQQPMAALFEMPQPEPNPPSIRPLQRQHRKVKKSCFRTTESALTPLLMGILGA